MKEITQLIYRHDSEVTLDEETLEYEEDITVLRVSYDNVNVMTLYCTNITDEEMNDEDMFLHVELFDMKKEMLINKNNIITKEDYECHSIAGTEDGVDVVFFYAISSGLRYDTVNVFDKYKPERVGPLEIVVKPFLTMSADEFDDM